MFNSNKQILQTQLRHQRTRLIRASTVCLKYIALNLLCKNNKNTTQQTLNTSNKNGLARQKLK